MQGHKKFLKKIVCLCERVHALPATKTLETALASRNFGNPHRQWPSRPIMRKYAIIGLDLALVAFFIGSILSGAPLRQKGEIALVASSAQGLTADR
jgi:hypothetical protein